MWKCIYSGDRKIYIDTEYGHFKLMHSLLFTRWRRLMRSIFVCISRSGMPMTGDEQRRRRRWRRCCCCVVCLEEIIISICQLEWNQYKYIWDCLIRITCWHCIQWWNPCPISLSLSLPLGLRPSFSSRLDVCLLYNICIYIRYLSFR